MLLAWGLNSIMTTAFQINFQVLITSIILNWSQATSSRRYVYVFQYDHVVTAVTVKRRSSHSHSHTTSIVLCRNEFSYSYSLSKFLFIALCAVLNILVEVLSLQFKTTWCTRVGVQGHTAAESWLLESAMVIKQSVCEGEQTVIDLWFFLLIILAIQN